MKRALIYTAFAAQLSLEATPCQTAIKRSTIKITFAKLDPKQNEESAPLHLRYLPEVEIVSLEPGEGRLDRATENSTNESAFAVVSTDGKVANPLKLLGSLKDELEITNPNWRKNPRLVENFKLLEAAALEGRLKILLGSVISIGEDASNFTVEGAIRPSSEANAPIQVLLGTESSLSTILHELDHAAEFIRNPQAPLSTLERYAMATDRKATGRAVMLADYSYGPMADLEKFISLSEFTENKEYRFIAPEIPQRELPNLQEIMRLRKQGIVVPREPLYIPQYDSAQKIALKLIRTHRRYNTSTGAGISFRLEEAGNWSRFTEEQQLEVRNLFDWAIRETRRIDSYYDKTPPPPPPPSG